MRELRVVACIIVGDTCEESSWKRLMDSLIKAGIWGLSIAYNGTKDDFPYELPDQLKDHSLIAAYPWNDDFAEQRNHSFDQAQHMDADWLIWIDTDDELVLEEGESLQTIVDSLDPYSSGAFCRYDYGIDPATKTVVVEQWRERLLKADAPWLWEYAIHEVCHGPFGTQFARSEKFYVKHHRIAGADDTTTRTRNRRILVKQRKAHPEIHRYTFYLASEIFAEAHYKLMTGQDVDEAEELAMTAAMLFQEYVSHDSGSDDAYVATARMAECYRLCGDYLKAIDVELQCIKLQPSWPDAHVGIAQSYMGLGDWDRVEHWARSALELTSKPDTPLVRETLQQTYSPRVLMGMARESKGDLDGALKYYEKAYAEAQVETLELRIKDLQVKLKDSKHKEGWSEAAVDERKLLRGTKPEKSIAFVTAPLFETWHPLTGEGHGGAESMIIELAPRFAKAGWRVAVFGTPGEFRGVDMDGVEWWNTGEYLPSEHFTVVVGSRIPQLYDSPVSADLRLLWAHDVNFGESIASDAFGSRIDRIDGIIALTQWHANHLRRLYPDVRAKNIMVIPNGVDVARYTNWDITQKDPNKFVWSSSPDRGIEVILEMWPDIKAIVPDAHLDVYYGWAMIDKIVGTQENTFLEMFKQNTMREVARINDNIGGINWFDRVDKKTLADQQMHANMWLYPTHFLETFCITAIEAQLAGAIPLVSNKGALSETVAMPDCKIDGWSGNAAYRSRWLKQFETIVKDENMQQRLRDAGRVHAKQFDWDNVFNVWTKYIASRTGQTSHALTAA